MTVEYDAEGRDGIGVRWTTYEKNRGRPMSIQIDADRWYSLSESDKERVMMNDVSRKFPEVVWHHVCKH